MADEKRIHLSPPLASLRSFEAAARHLSFTTASKELHITSAAVSQHVRSLEQIFRRKLFHRLPRGLILTEHGEAYLPVVQGALGQLEIGTQRIFGTPDRREIVIKVTASLAIAWLGAILPDLQADFPNFRLVLTTYHWNLESSDLTVDLEIRHGHGSWPNVSAKKLVEEEIFPVCSSEYLKQSRSINTPTDLIAHRLLHNISPFDGWVDWFRTAGVKDDVQEPELTVDSTLIALQLAKFGHGVALGRTLLIEDDLESGRLVLPFDIRHRTREAFYLVQPKQRRQRRDVIQIADWLTEAVQQRIRR